MDQTHLLVVDDEVLILHLLQRVIRKMVERRQLAPPVIMTADDVQPAKDQLQRLAANGARVHLITDGKMPGGNGMQVVEAARALLGDRLAACAFHSSDEPMLRLAQDAGIPCLRKPAALHQMEAFLHAFLS